MSNLLKDKVCLVTGAAKGIGRAIAERFAEEGAVVYANDCRETDLEWTKSSADLYTTPVVPLCFDICDFTAAKQAILHIKKEQGKIDVLVNNAGIVTYEYLGMIDFEKLRKMFDVNVIALINLLQLTARVMSRQNSGSIINMASMVGVKGAKGQLSYSATKGAVISVTKSAAKELAENKIRVNAVAPGMVGTERFKTVMENSFKEKQNDIGFGRLAEPKEIADACVFLASDMSVYITGQVLGVDGAAII